MPNLEPLLTFWQWWRHCGENILIAGLIIEGIALFFDKWKRIEKSITAVGTLGIILGVVIEIIAGGHTDDVVSRMRAPTTITDSERAAILSCLKNGPKGTVFVVPKLFDENGGQYAPKVMSLLKGAGFDAEPEPPKESAPLSFGAPGAVLFVKRLTQPPRGAVSLQQCFTKNGFELSGSSNIPAWADDNIVFAIGSKL